MYNFQKVYKLNRNIFHNYANSTLYESAKPDAKDIKRILDLVAKTTFPSKQEALAQKMCNAIKDAGKMERRYAAALLELGANHVVTKVFKQGCIDMGIITDDNTTLLTSNDDSILPEPDSLSEKPKEEKTIEEPINKKKVTRAVNKLSATSAKEFKDLQLFGDTEDFYDMPFEYIKKLEQYRTYLKLKIYDLNVTKYLEDFLYKKYKELHTYDIINNDFTIHGINCSSGTIILSFTVRYSYYINNYNKSYYLIKVGYAIYNILEDTWEIRQLNKESEYSGGWYGNRTSSRGYPRNLDASEKIAGCLKSVGSAIRNALKENKEIKAFIDAYNKFSNALYTKALDISTDGYSIIKGYNKINKLIEKICDMMCDKYDIDTEPDDNWSGFKITSIKDSTIIFSTFLGSQTSSLFVTKIANDLNKLRYPLEGYVNQLSGLNLHEEAQVLYEFFINTMNIDKQYIFLSNYGERTITIDLLQFVDALKA